MINSIEEVVKLLKNSKKVAIFCHTRPDGDALGGMLALTLALRSAGKHAVAFCEDEPSEKFSFLPAMKEVKTTFKAAEYDLFVSVDCADLARMGSLSNPFAKFKGITLNIDHHISNTKFAKYNYVNECPASCQILASILTQAKFDINKEVADLLMLGLITDSGNFTHSDVTAVTFQTAATLRDLGADVQAINYYMYQRQPKARAELYGRVMKHIHYLHDDKFAYIIISARDIKECGADNSMTEGFVDFPLTVDGVEVSAALLEFKKGQYKTSLRSKGKVNVNAVASLFGGGGHILASGCMLFGSLEEVIDKLSYAVYQNLS